MIALARQNAILVVEFARDLQAEGMSLPDAWWSHPPPLPAHVMTSFAFIFGVVPLMKAAGRAASQ